MKTKISLIAISLLLSFYVSITFASTQEVNLYSARKETLIRPLLDAFTEKTGIKVNIISGKADALLNRIETEGQNSPADVLLTSDAGRLWRAKDKQLLAPVKSNTLMNNIPAQYKDPENQWFGLSLRARTIMVNKNYQGAMPSTYEDLIKPEFKSKICIRSSNNIYNQSLIASMIESQGEQATLSWVTALVKQFARKPQGGDRDQIRAVALGLCPFAIANTYYLAAMLSPQSSEKDQKAAQSIKVIWSNQQDRGTHINISGGAVLKSAPNHDNAVQFLEYLSSDEAQKIYADVNFEYPIKENVEANPILSSWGTFKSDSLNVITLGKNNAKAVIIMDKANWK